MNQIICGHTPEVLKIFKPETFDCVVTSSPYWGLRDYGIEPQIWDGNGDCEHRWGDFLLHPTRGNRGQGDDPKYRIRKDCQPTITDTQFCSLCSAWKGSLGLEPTPELYIKHLCDIFDEVKRVLKKTGSVWVNIGDSYGGGGFGHENITAEEFREKYPKQGSVRGTALSGEGRKKLGDIKRSLLPKSLVGIPEMFVLEMQRRGWIRRNTIVWHKPNCMPSSAKDRFTVDFEYVYFFTKSQRYFFERQFEPALIESRLRYKGKFTGDYNQNKETALSVKGRNSERDFDSRGRNKRCVWQIPTQSFPEAHFATFPEKLVEECIKPGCPEGGIVLDPFAGSGTVGLVAQRMNRKWVLIDIKQEYCEMAEKRLRPLLAQEVIPLHSGSP